MMTLDEIRASLEGRNLAEIARALRVTRSYLSLIRAGKAGNPSYGMVKALSDYLEQKVVIK